MRNLRELNVLKHLGRGLFVASFAYIGVTAASAASNQSSPVEVGYDDPLQVVVSLDQQRLELYRGADLIHEAPISSGKRGHTTPRGIFSVLEKRRHHFSNLYDDAPMPFMQRLTWSGIALHQGRLPGYPASHGCIRMTRSTSAELFRATSRGMHVIITREKQQPVAFAHKKLPVPAPILAARKARLAAEKSLKTAPLRTASLMQSGVDSDLAQAVLRIGADQEVARLAALQGQDAQILEPQTAASKSQKPIRVLISRQTERERLRAIQQMLTDLGQSPGPVDGVVGRKTRAAIKAFQARTGRPVDGRPHFGLESALMTDLGLTERHNARLYVRQGFKPLFKAGMSLTGEGALGTHLYTAQDFSASSDTLRWTALTAEAVEGTSPKAALDRVVLPDSVASRLSAAITPGSSIIISDRGISRETGRGTDFIVLTR